MSSSLDLEVLQSLDPAVLAAYLESTGAYRVLRRMQAVDDFGGRVDQPVRVMVIDTETTGLDFEQSEVIELGAVVVEVDQDTGVLGKVLGQFGGLEEPEQPIPPESTAIHGITNDMVKGHRLDEAAFQLLCRGVQLFVAHNAAFDKPFVLRRFPWLEGTVWACSFKELPWDEEGYSGKKLEYLLSETGYFHDAHRAVEDCHALAHVLASPLKQSHRQPMSVLFDSANESFYEIAAINSPFDKKDLMKNRGFRWNAEERTWAVEVRNFVEGKAMIEFLREQVYCTTGKVRLGFRTYTPALKYSKLDIRQQFKDV